MPPRTRYGFRGRGRGSAQQDPQSGERPAGGNPLQEIPVVESASENVTRPAIHPRNEAGPSAPSPLTGQPVVDCGAIAAVVAQVIRQLDSERGVRRNRDTFQRGQSSAPAQTGQTSRPFQSQSHDTAQVS
ncbi:hypothetical protein ACH5RR_023608 [Cinchona calisaya]|uniref:Uncharacterized protein n=1 Tax=Cinchona calisaya TaxID=153742 RepID=A0ABD2ZB60_9GENT